MSATEQFRDAIRRFGLTPPDRIEAGRFHRFPGIGKSNGNRAGWCKLFPDGIGGVFGDYSHELAEQWQAELGRPLSLVEIEGFRELARKARAEAEAKRIEEQAEAAGKAVAIWEAAKPAEAAHPYLVRKGIKAHGARLATDGRLLIPLRADGELHSLQLIDGEGGKRFLPGSRKKGCWHLIGAVDGAKALCLAEGFSTAASIHEATGYPVAIAFDRGNLKPVALALRALYRDMTIIVCADDDYRTEGNPGVTDATEAARAVDGRLAIPEFGDDRPEGATDFNDLAAHRGAEAVNRAIARVAASGGSTVQPGSGNATAGQEWPAALAPAAFHGLAGEFVRMIEPVTESDPAAILMQFLVAFGVLVGRNPYYRVEATRHHANLFIIMVGRSSKARKGTAWDRTREPFEKIEGWKPHASGLSSGEGLKYHVRDPIEETKSNDKGELITKIVDNGVSDKRLLVFEAEFATVLKVAERQGNTLSATVREAFDTGNLRTLTKHDPITVTGAHIAIIGHIVADELRALLTATDAANGFANRFLFVAVKRSKLLPFGGDELDEGEVQALIARLCEKAELARTRSRMTMTPAAKAVWSAVYAPLSEGSEGLHGAVTARAEALCVRLALVYALLDGAAQIDAPHLQAALAVWKYCDATARHIFGASLGDRTADEILRRLVTAGEAGLTLTDISAIFGRNQPAERIGAALELLQRKGRASCEKVSTGGRKSELWRATK